MPGTPAAALVTLASEAQRGLDDVVHGWRPRQGEDANHEQRQPTPLSRLDAYKVAKELARRVHEARIGDSELRDQATRASKSAFLGLCEGLPSDAPGIRRRHFDIANNSLHEVIGAVDLAEAIGALDADVARELLSLAVRLKRMLRALPR